MPPARPGRESAAEESPDSFDPGLETGYLRRERDHDLDPELGAAPFDPGTDHYDDRRARRAARRAEKDERKRRKQEELRREAAERARARRTLDERARREREQQERNRRESERRQRIERERRIAAERLAQLERRREQARSEHAERAARARAERERLAGRRRPATAQAAPSPAPRLQPAGRPATARPTAPVPATPSPTPRLKRVPAAATPGPSPTVAPPGGPSLRRPTLKAAFALAAVTAAALAAGSAIGLPLPDLDSGDGTSQTAALGPGASTFALDGGTPPGLSSGPFFPVVLDQPADFGEGAAKFGAPRGGRRHEGQDVFAKPGTPLIAVRDGVVLDGAGGRNFYASGGGNTLVIYSPLDNRSYVYLHMLKPPLVKAGEQVRAGQPVGQVGCTGSCFGPHLHFEVRNGRAEWGAETKAVDPLPILRQWPQVPRATP